MDTCCHHLNFDQFEYVVAVFIPVRKGERTTHRGKAIDDVAGQFILSHEGTEEKHRMH